MAHDSNPDKYSLIYMALWKEKPRDILEAMKQRLTAQEHWEFIDQGPSAQALYFARHENFLPMIQTTNYRDPLAVDELTSYICVFSGFVRCSFPVGTINDTEYQLIPDPILWCVMNPQEQLQDELPEERAAGQSNYLRVQKCAISIVAGRNQAMVPKTDVFPNLESPTTSEGSTFSHSPSANSSQFSAKTLPAALESVVSGPFFYLGKLGVRGHRSRITPLDYHVLVSLIDFSVWIQYCGWNFHYNDDDKSDDSEGEVFGSPFKPEYDRDWAKLAGCESRVLMAQIAKDVRQWTFTSDKLALAEIWSDEEVVPAICAAAFVEPSAPPPGA
ncbi:MAG: hypothetical protein M1829_001996 [Trizodia sp. TS-e1964]|nr:MAG: hypothetical protein M1829_001996 [Trizodia sp. TS-e1964]